MEDSVLVVPLPTAVAEEPQSQPPPSPAVEEQQPQPPPSPVVEEQQPQPPTLPVVEEELPPVFVQPPSSLPPPAVAESAPAQPESAADAKNRVEALSKWVGSVAVERLGNAVLTEDKAAYADVLRACIQRDVRILQGVERDPSPTLAGNPLAGVSGFPGGVGDTCMHLLSLVNAERKEAIAGLVNTPAAAPVADPLPYVCTGLLGRTEQKDSRIPVFDLQCSLYVQAGATPTSLRFAKGPPPEGVRCRLRLGTVLVSGPRAPGVPGAIRWSTIRLSDAALAEGPTVVLPYPCLGASHGAFSVCVFEGDATIGGVPLEPATNAHPVTAIVLEEGTGVPLAVYRGLGAATPLQVRIFDMGEQIVASGAAGEGQPKSQVEDQPKTRVAMVAIHMADNSVWQINVRVVGSRVTFLCGDVSTLHMSPSMRIMGTEGGPINALAIDPRVPGILVGTMLGTVGLIEIVNIRDPPTDSPLLAAMSAECLAANGIAEPRFAPLVKLQQEIPSGAGTSIVPVHVRHILIDGWRTIIVSRDGFVYHCCAWKPNASLVRVPDRGTNTKPPHAGAFVWLNFLYLQDHEGRMDVLDLNSHQWSASNRWLPLNGVLDFCGGSRGSHTSDDRITYQLVDGRLFDFYAVAAAAPTTTNK